MMPRFRAGQLRCGRGKLRRSSVENLSWRRTGSHLKFPQAVAETAGSMDFLDELKDDGAAGPAVERAARRPKSDPPRTLLRTISTPRYGQSTARRGIIMLRWVDVAIIIAFFGLLGHTIAPASAQMNSSSAYDPKTCSVITTEAACASYSSSGCSWCGRAFGCLLAEPVDAAGNKQTGLFECPRRRCNIGPRRCSPSNLAFRSQPVK